MTEVVGHFLVFTVAAIGFLIAPLLIGRLVRPRLPTAEKDATYECGEPTIGSSYIQFDLRFYVVALLFIIFDVEVVFFFPWATVFGTAMQLTDPELTSGARRVLSEQLLSLPAGSITDQTAVTAATALQLGWTAFVDVAAFFAVLLVGFAYVWKRGDLDWVRTTAERKSTIGATSLPLSQVSPKKPAPVTAS
ncbi:MAG: NADH-quinone oxidoreductase subunit A [Schlesneria sp.]